MPVPVTIAAALQLLLAASFVVIALIAHRYGDAAQHAAEAEAVRQGHPAGVLAAHRVRFAETTTEMLLPLAIGVVIGVLAAVNLAGVQAGRIATWVLAPVLVVAGGLVTATQVFAARFTAAVFRKSTTASGIDAYAIVDAASRTYPAILRPLVLVRFALTTLGTLAVVILLALPAANAHFG
ncbi:hypothetical protein [Fodinicola acaciae]|uniref:hypothetical protein n=1 Tax=Fodinicola acaciae TaxID=2681555 RepID=UPI0013D86F3F|nr:hypothetical protein [Fodinicola acaciae]